MVLRIALAVVAVALGACQVCSDPVPARPLSDEPGGARCHTSADCADGLPCLEGFCSPRCSGTPLPITCPAGSNCVLTGLCFPACASDADCQLGSTAGRCTPASGDEPSYCFPASCDSDAECPSGSRCVEASRASGITWNSTCTTGWCQRQ